MNRIRWMRATFPGSIRQISKQLQKAAFGADSDEGFVVDRVRDDFLEARYFERVSFQQSVTDPFGKTFVIDRLDFRQVDFTLKKSFPELELRMAPRGIKGFASGLLKASGFTMQLEQQMVGLTKWVSALEREIGAKVSIRAAVAAGIEVPGGVKAKIIVSGPSDVRRGLNLLIPNHSYELDTVELEMKFGQSPQRVILSNDSTVRYSPATFEDAITATRAAFTSLQGEKR